MNSGKAPTMATFHGLSCSSGVPRLQVGMPQVRPLAGKLWEMRMTGRDGSSRAVYASLQGRRPLVLHVFTKKTQTTPLRAVDSALKRLDSLPWRP